MPHIHEKIDFCVEVFVVCKDKVLLRKHDKYKFWLSVGGHIELEEDPNQAAIREVKEEVGLDIKLMGKVAVIKETEDGYRELIPPRFLNRHRINDAHEHIALTYFATSNNDRVIASDKEKSEECRWFNLSELDEEKYGIKEKVKYYAKCAINEIGQKTT